MPGTTSGTGYASLLRCYACRRGNPGGSRGRSLWATGATKALPVARIKSNYRCTTRLIQVWCLDCGTTGWTKHIDAERLLEAKKTP